MLGTVIVAFIRSLPTVDTEQSQCAASHPKMDSKFYHGTEFSAEEFYNAFLSDTTDRQLQAELVIFPMNKLREELASGRVKGRSLVEYTVGPVMFKLLVCCEYFEEMYVLEFNKNCRIELERWLKNEPGSLDWSHMTQHTCEMEGNRDGLKEKEAKVRERVKRVIACKLTGDDLVTEGPVPQSDCLVCIYGLDVISHNQEAFCDNLNKLSSFLKSDGQLMLIGFFNGTFFKVGKHNLHLLPYDNQFLKKSLSDCGFALQTIEVQNRKHVCEYISYDALYYVRALKVQGGKK